MQPDNKEKFEREIRIEVERGLYLLDEYLEKNLDTVKKDFIKNIIDILNDLQKQQQDNKIDIIGSMCFVLSRTEIDNENFIYPILLYGEKMYVDIYEINSSLDVSVFYRYLKDIKEKGLGLSKKYTKEEISMPIIEREIYKYLKYFNQYVVNTLRLVFQDETVLKEITVLNTTNSFAVLQNEMYEQPYCIYEKSSDKGGAA